MKFVVVAFYVAFVLAAGVDAASVSLSNSQLTLSGNAHIQFYAPREEIWAALSVDHRYPLINSGDVIALRLAYSPGKSLADDWLYCDSDYCSYTSCQGTFMKPSSWSSCSSNIIFKITAMGKMVGQPINSGDTVTLTSKAYGYTSSYHLRCDTSTSFKCRMYASTYAMTGNNWLAYSYTTFIIYSRNAVDGTPVQYGDIVGFKYPYGSQSAWLYRSSSYFYSLSCSSTSKTSCANANIFTGFQIFKQL